MFKRIWVYLVYRFKPVKTEFSYGGTMAQYSQRDLDRQAGIAQRGSCETMSEIERLTRERDEILAALRELVDLKDIKDGGGTYSQYRKQGAWDRARLALPGYVRPPIKQ